MTKFFITGVSCGLGLELMKQVVAHGGFVYGVSRREMPEDPILTEFTEKWIWRACDVTQDDEIRQAIEHQKSIGFLPDVVVLNAGTHSRDGKDFGLDKYQRLFQVNCLGALKWVQSYLRPFEERGRGHFVYISSLASLYPFPRRANYSASKAYTSFVFECFKKRYCPGEVQFSVFYLGFIETEMSSQAPVPGFFRIPVSKAAKKILDALPKGSRSVRFPLRGVFLEWVLSVVPDRFLLKLVNKKYSS